jgi:MFS family permease
MYYLLQGTLGRFYVPLILIRLLHGVGLAFCFTSAFTYVSDIIPENRLNEGFGMFGVTGLMGMAIGPVIAEMVIREFGFPAFFFTAAGLATTGLALHLPLPESYRQGIRPPSSQSFFFLLKGKRIFSVAVLAFLFGVGLAASSNFVTPFAHQSQVEFVSYYFICYSVSAVFTRFFGGRLADRAGEERIIPYALTLTGAGLFELMFLGGTTVLVISGLVSGLGHGLLFPSLNALAIRKEPVNIRGKVTGIFTGGIDAGAFVGSILLGYIGEWAGYRYLFFAAGFALLSGLAVIRIEVFRKGRL